MIHSSNAQLAPGDDRNLETGDAPAGRASVVCGAAVALLAALALSFSLIADSFAQDAAPDAPLVLADAGVQPESAGPSFRSAPEPEQIELLRRLLGVPSAKPLPSTSSTTVAPASHSEPSVSPRPIEPVAPAAHRSRPVTSKPSKRVERERSASSPTTVESGLQNIPSSEASAAAAIPTRFDQVLSVSSRDLPNTGSVLREKDVDRWEHLLVPAMRWAVRRGVPIEIAAAKPIVMEPARAEATERYHAQVELGADHKSLVNYVAGIPFPYVAADDANAAARLIFNAEKRILFDDVDGRNFGCRTGSIDEARGLQVERDYRAEHFRRLYYSGRLLVDPKPLWETGEGIHYRESISPFLEPFDYKGAGVTYTRYEDSSRPDDSWLYYPQSRRVRRLGTAQRSDGLFGLDIDLDSYGGFAGNPVWFDWELLGKKTLLAPFHPKHQPMRWAEKPGDFLFADQWEARETWMIAARSRVPGYNFSLRVIYVDAQSMLIPYTEVYDKDGQLWRAYVQQWKAGVDRSMPYTSAPAFRSPTAVVAGLSVFDMQQSHATLCEIPAADAPREEAWHLFQGDNGGSVPEDFDLAAFITAGR